MGQGTKHPRQGLVVHSHPNSGLTSFVMALGCEQQELQGPLTQSHIGLGKPLCDNLRSGGHKRYAISRNPNVVHRSEAEIDGRQTLDIATCSIEHSLPLSQSFVGWTQSVGLLVHVEIHQSVAIGPSLIHVTIMLPSFTIITHHLTIVINHYLTIVINHQLMVALTIIYPQEPS